MASPRSKAKPAAGRVLGPAAAVSGRKSKVRAQAGTTTYKAKPKAPPRPPQESGDVLGEIGRTLDKLIPTRPWKHPVVPKPRRDVNVPTIVNRALGK